MTSKFTPQNKTRFAHSPKFDAFRTQSVVPLCNYVQIRVFKNSIKLISKFFENFTCSVSEGNFSLFRIILISTYVDSNVLIYVVPSRRIIVQTFGDDFEFLVHFMKHLRWRAVLRAAGDFHGFRRVDLHVKMSKITTFFHCRLKHLLQVTKAVTWSWHQKLHHKIRRALPTPQSLMHFALNQWFHFGITSRFAFLKIQ